MADLPLVELLIDDNDNSDFELQAIAFVDKPAIKKNFLKFSETPVQKFAQIDKARRIVSGPALLANTPIYRNVDGYEFNAYFSPETVYKLVQKYFRKGMNNTFNFMHSEGMELGNVTLFESFITDAERGIKPMAGFEDAPNGSWFVSAFVENEAAWKFIEDGSVKGFSVEGMFGSAKKLTVEEKLMEDIIAILNEHEQRS